LVAPLALAEAVASSPSPVVLVLDDFHELRDLDVLHQIRVLLRHAPAQLRVLVVSRGEPPLPLHRYRLRGVVTEITADQLAFTDAEASALLDRAGVVLDA